MQYYKIIGEYHAIVGKYFKIIVISPKKLNNDVEYVMSGPYGGATQKNLYATRVPRAWLIMVKIMTRNRRNRWADP